MSINAGRLRLIGGGRRCEEAEKSNEIGTHQKDNWKLNEGNIFVQRTNREAGGDGSKKRPGDEFFQTRTTEMCLRRKRARAGGDVALKLNAKCGATGAVSSWLMEQNCQIGSTLSIALGSPHFIYARTKLATERKVQRLGGNKVLKISLGEGGEAATKHFGSTLRWTGQGDVFELERTTTRKKKE